MGPGRVEAAACRLAKKGEPEKATSSAEERTRRHRVEAAACRFGEHAPGRRVYPARERSSKAHLPLRRVEAAACRFSESERAGQARLPCKRTILEGAATLALVLLATVADAATLTVALDGSGDFTSIHTAITQADDGDIILVKPGEYHLDEPLDFRGNAIAVVGEEGAAATVLRLIATEETDRSSVVVFISGEGADARLDGFTLTEGRGVRSCAACPRRGGAIYCVGASPTLKDLVMTGNTADFGGGVYLAGDAEPTLTDCVVEKNTATIGGGICIAAGSQPRITGSTIATNSAATGGGLHVSGAAPSIEQTTVRDNVAGAEDEGGGMYLGDGARAAFRDCTIERNVAGTGGGISCVRAMATFDGCSIMANRAVGDRQECNSNLGRDDVCIYPGGGGVRCLEADPEFIECRISANTARNGDGGGVQLEFSSPRFFDCVLSGNVARRGGGVFASVGEPELDRCTVAWNSASGAWLGGAGGIASFGTATPITARNSIVWGNAGGSFSRSSPRTVVATHSCVEGGHDGESNIPNDPLFRGWDRSEIFVDPSAQNAGDGSAERPFPHLLAALDSEYDLTLRAESPCRGAGEGGIDLGADLEGSAHQTSGSLTIRLAAGNYDAPGHIDRGVSLEGAGAEETVLVGTVRILSTVSRLSALTVTGGAEGGVIVWQRTRDVPRGEAELHDVVIRENDGPGLFVGECQQESSFVRLVNCVIRDNHGPGTQSGGNASIVLDRCTVAGNQPLRRQLRFDVPDACGTSVQEAGGIVAEGPATIVSSIVWNNASPTVTGRTTATFSCIEFGHPGQGNIALDPRFCGRPHGPQVDGDLEGLLDSPLDLSLRADSPCLGTGRDGVNMGAYGLGDCDDALYFLRGDCNTDGEVNLSDAVCLLGGLFLSRGTAGCRAATNVNGDGSVDIADPIYLLGHLFGGGPAPPGPFPECGASQLEIDAELGCSTSCE